MILDRLDTSDRYHGLGPRFAAGFAYLRGTELASLADGRYAVEGDDVVAVVQTYQTRPLELGRWEAHRNHADIQYIVRGVERMGVAPQARMAVQPPYDPDKDTEFYLPGDGALPRSKRGATGGVGGGGVGAAAGPGAQFCRVEAGGFTVFLPHDIHMPNLQIDGPAEVKKVVIKVRL